TTTVRPEELASLGTGKQILKLSLHGAYLDGSMLREALSSLGSLTELGLQGTRINEDVLAKVPSFTSHLRRSDWESSHHSVAVTGSRQSHLDQLRLLSLKICRHLPR